MFNFVIVYTSSCLLKVQYVRICIKISKNHLHSVIYFFQVCNYIILNVSKNL